MVTMTVGGGTGGGGGGGGGTSGGGMAGPSHFGLDDPSTATESGDSGGGGTSGGSTGTGGTTTTSGGGGTSGGGTSDQTTSPTGSDQQTSGGVDQSDLADDAILLNKEGRTKLGEFGTGADPDAAANYETVAQRERRTGRDINQDQVVGSRTEQQGIETQTAPEGPGEQGVETRAGTEGDQARSLEQRFLNQNPGFTAADVRVVRDGSTFRASLTESARKRREIEAAQQVERKLLEELGLQDSSLVAVQRQEDSLVATLTGAGERHLATANLEQQFESEYTTAVEPGEHFTVAQEGDSFVAQLTDEGEDLLNYLDAEDSARPRTAFEKYNVPTEDTARPRTAAERYNAPTEDTARPVRAGETARQQVSRVGAQQEGERAEARAQIREQFLEENPGASTDDFRVTNLAAQGDGRYSAQIERTTEPEERHGDVPVYIRTGGGTRGAMPSQRRATEGSRMRLETAFGGISDWYQENIAEPAGETARYSPGAIAERGYNLGRQALEGQDISDEDVEQVFTGEGVEAGVIERAGVRITRGTVGFLDPGQFGSAIKEGAELGSWYAGGIAQDVGERVAEGPRTVGAAGPGPGARAESDFMEFETTGARAEQTVETGSAVVRQAIATAEREFRERPLETVLVGAGTLAGSAVLMGGAGAISKGAGRATAYAVQPGEEIFGAVGSRATRAVAGRGAARRFFPNKEPIIFSEEFALRQARRAGGAVRRTATGRAGLTPTTAARLEFTRGQAPFAGTGRMQTEFATEPEVAEYSGVRSEPLGSGGRGPVLTEADAAEMERRRRRDQPTATGGAPTETTTGPRQGITEEMESIAGEATGREQLQRAADQFGTELPDQDAAGGPFALGFSPGARRAIQTERAERAAPSEPEYEFRDYSETGTVQRDIYRRSLEQRRGLEGDYEGRYDPIGSERRRLRRARRSEVRAETETETEGFQRFEPFIGLDSEQDQLGIQLPREDTRQQQVPDTRQEPRPRYETPGLEFELEAETRRALRAEMELFELELEGELESELEAEFEAESFRYDRDRRERNRPFTPLDATVDFYQAPVATARELATGALEEEAGLGDLDRRR